MVALPQSTTAAARAALAVTANVWTFLTSIAPTLNAYVIPALVGLMLGAGGTLGVQKAFPGAPAVSGTAPADYVTRFIAIEQAIAAMRDEIVIVQKTLDAKPASAQPMPLLSPPPPKKSRHVKRASQ